MDDLSKNLAEKLRSILQEADASGISGLTLHEGPSSLMPCLRMGSKGEEMAGHAFHIGMYPEGKFVVRVEHLGGSAAGEPVRSPDTQPIAHYVSTEMEGLIIAGLRTLIGTWSCSPSEDERATIIDYIEALNSDTYLMETATPRPTPDTPLLDRPICEAPQPSPHPGPVVTPDWPDAPLPEMVVPTPDDPKYTQLFDRMLTIVEDIALAQRLEDSDRDSEAEDAWDRARGASRKVLDDLKPEPVVSPKQFHSGWSVPPAEAECTCAGTWLDALQHIDEALKDIERHSDDGQAVSQAHRAREVLTGYMVNKPDEPCWVACGDVVYWIAELPA